MGKVSNFSKWQPQTTVLHVLRSSVVHHWLPQLLFQRSVSGGFTGQLHLLPFIFEALGFLKLQAKIRPSRY